MFLTTQFGLSQIHLHLAIEPGGTYEGRQDGLADPTSHPGKVYKIVDNITVNPDGSISTSGGDLVDNAGQWLIGGWKDDRWQKDLRENKDLPGMSFLKNPGRRNI